MAAPNPIEQTPISQGKISSISKNPESGSLEWIALVLVVVLAAALRLWRIDQNGTGNPYYAAAVRSMLQSWHNFFFVSFDPAGFVTVDKPPVSLWVQTAFAKLFGYRGFTLILPQVLEGLGAVVLLYHLVRRSFGPWAAFFSASILALSPVSVAVDRYNNTDACLVLVLLFSAWSLSRAAETGNRMLFYLALVLVGIGFNTKMMAAFVVLPAFYIVYWLGCARPWLRRLGDLTLGSLLLLIVALSWPLAVDLTPPEQRPFIGSTQDNSMVGLSLGWNGFQRLLSRGRAGFGRNRRPGPAAINPELSNGPTTGTSNDPAEPPDPTDAVSQRFGRRGGGFMNTGTPGPLRLADKNLAGQVGWFLPLALLGFGAAFRRSRFHFPLSPPHQASILWLCWFLLYAAVFSFMRGAMHAYYLVLLAPPLAALGGIGLRALWLYFQEGVRAPLFLGLFLTASWQAFIVFQYPDWRPLLLPLLFSGIGLSLAGLFIFSAFGKTNPRSNSFLSASLGLGICALFLCPTLWALTPVLGSGQSVEANPELITDSHRSQTFRDIASRQNMDRLLDFLKSNRRGEAYLLVAQNSQLVAPIIINTGEPVVAIGGFMGADPILTVHEFAEKIKEGQFRYMLLSDQTRPGGPGEGRRQSFEGNGGGFDGGFGRRAGPQADIAKWVRANGKPVDPALWKPAVPPAAAAPTTQGFGGRRGELANLQLYDLRPGPKSTSVSKN